MTLENDQVVSFKDNIDNKCYKALVSNEQTRFLNDQIEHLKMQNEKLIRKA